MVGNPVVADKNIHRESWVNVGTQMGNHMSINIKMLLFYFYKQSTPITQTEILETTFYKILYHDMRFATNQKLKVTPGKVGNNTRF